MADRLDRVRPDEHDLEAPAIAVLGLPSRVLSRRCIAVLAEVELLDEPALVQVIDEQEVA